MSSEYLRPLAQLPVPPNLLGVLTDIDDTLTTQGQVPPPVVQALGRLRAAGLKVVPITGRSMGWSEPHALDWPVDAIVAENGAAALRRNARGELERLYQIADHQVRAANYARMQQVLAQIEAQVPGARRSADSHGRECDIAVDHSEHTRMAPEHMEACMALMRAAGMNATVSSIHINGWYGQHDKLLGARWILRQLFDLDLDATLPRWIYIGDSLNDQVMFRHLPHTVGVANIARFMPRLQHLPRYVTQAERGAGFIELVDHILQK